MIAFMLVGFGRCGTTWAANWLTTGPLLCHHEPLRYAARSALDATLSAPGRQVGVSCTGLWTWPDWLNAHPARKVILHRPLGETARSYARLGLPMLATARAPALQAIEGLHVDWRDLFDPAGARAIWAHLTDAPFDAERHAALVQMNVQPHVPGFRIDPAAGRALVVELAQMARGGGR